MGSGSRMSQEETCPRLGHRASTRASEAVLDADAFAAQTSTKEWSGCSSLRCFWVQSGSVHACGFSTFRRSDIAGTKRPKSLHTAMPSRIACFIFGSADAPIGEPTLSPTSTEKERRTLSDQHRNRMLTMRVSESVIEASGIAPAFDNGGKIKTSNVEDRKSSPGGGGPATGARGASELRR